MTTGCGVKAQPHRANVTRAQVSSTGYRTEYRAEGSPLAVDTAIPAPVRLSQLKRSNTWYNTRFVTSQEGYRWGFRNTQFALQHTGDRGRHWEAVSLPANWMSSVASNVDSATPFVQVKAPGALFVLSQSARQLTVLASESKAQIWSQHQFRLPDDNLRIHSVSMLSNGDGWVVLSNATSGKVALLLHIQLADVARTQVQRVDGSTRAPALGGSVQAVVRFVTPEQGWIVARWPDGKVRQFSTQDGGANWRCHVVVSPPSFAHFRCVQVYAPAVRDDGTGTFVARYVGFQSGHAVVHTAVFWTEAGKTSMFAEPVDTIDFAVSDYWGTPIAWLDADSGFTIRDSRLIVTHDAGASWVWIPSRQLERALSQFPRILSLQFVSQTDGFAYLQSRDYRQTILLATTDGGITWALRSN